MDFFVNFEDDEHVEENLPPKSLYDKEYDIQTTGWYKNMREKKYNIFTHELLDFDDRGSFKFHQTWDPITGERLENDPYGPLYFHPDDLIRFFYKRRLKMLWNEPKDDSNGYYEGYYGEAVGSGENIEAKGAGIKGICPELYLFRLPIDDCYLSPDSNKSIISMGPKLTNEEVREIDELAVKYHKNNYYECFGKKRPSLVQIKKMYDQSISKYPDILNSDDTNVLSYEQKQNLKDKINREAVDILRNL